MFRRPWSIRMHEGEFERKGCGNMKRYKVVFLFAMVASWMMIGEANDAVQTAAKTALRDVNGTSLGKLYKVRKQAETAERKEIVVKACVAGLYAIGDLKNARKIGEGLDVDELLDSFMSECDLCRGEGCSSRNCYKCKGAGTCQNSGCHEGRVIVQGFNGNHTERACSICRGTGHCPKCKGEGKLTETCRRCGGTKRSINKGKALGSCKELLKSLTVSLKNEQTTGGEDNATSPSRGKVREGKKVETEKELPKTPAVSPKEVQAVGSEENVHHPSQGKIQAGENVENEAEQETALPNASDEVRALEKERNKARLAFRKAEKEVASAQRACKSAEEKYRRSNSDSRLLDEWNEKERVLREAEDAKDRARCVLDEAERKLAEQLEDEKRKEEKRNKDNRMMSFVQQGLSVNESRAHEKFVGHKFDFESYYQWADPKATSVQKERIFYRLLRNSYRSGLYKDYVRCGFALVPDGLSFMVHNVRESDINGCHHYSVSLELLTHGEYCDRIAGKWQGNPVQDEDLRNYVSKELLFPPRIDLLVMAAGGIEVESWRRGMVIVSKGWVYDIMIFDAIETFKDGSRRPVKELRYPEFAFRSMEERLHFESSKTFDGVSFFE